MIKLLVPKHPPIAAALKYLAKIDENRWYSNFGPMVCRLEDKLAERFSGPYVVTTSSCTSGLTLAYLAARMRGARAIELPALTFPATWFAATNAGLDVIPVDVNNLTWMAPAVAAWGVPSYAPIVDAAGAIMEQRVPLVPKAPITAVFSLHATKPVSAGEGGFVVTWDEGEAQAIREMTNFGLPGNGGPSRRYGTNAKMSEYHAAIALAGLDAMHRDPWLQLYDWYDKHLAMVPNVTPQMRPRGAYPLLSVRLKVPAALAAVELLKRGIETRRWYTPIMTHHPMYDDMTGEQPHVRANGRKHHRIARPFLPVSEDLQTHLIGLPYHLYLTESDVAQVCEQLGDVVNNVVELAEWPQPVAFA